MPLSRHRPAVSAEQLPLVPGRRLGDRLQVLHHRSADAVGATLVALDRESEQRLTARVLIPLETGNSSDPHALHRIGRVMRTVREVGIVGLVRPRGTFPDELVRAPSAVIVYDHVREPSLRALIERVGPLPVHQAIGVVEGVARVLEEVHAAGLFHLAVSLDNVHMSVDALGTPLPRVYVLDVGVVDAIRQAAPRVLLPLDARSTAPEVIEVGPVDARADVYGLGALFWSLVGRSGPEAVDVPPHILKVVERATAMRPRDRFASVVELRDALVRALEGHPDDVTSRTRAGMGPLGPLPAPSIALGEASAEAETERAAPERVAQPVPSLTPPEPREEEPAPPPSPMPLVWGALAVAPFLVAVAVLAWIGTGGQLGLLDDAESPIVDEARGSVTLTREPVRPAPRPIAAVSPSDTLEATASPQDPADAVDAPTEPEPARGEAAPEPAAEILPAPEASVSQDAHPERGSPGDGSSDETSSEPAPSSSAPASRSGTGDIGAAGGSVAPLAHTTVSLVTVPAGAVVFDGDVIVGNTPLDVDLEGVARTLRVWLPGHETRDITVSGSAASMTVELQSETSSEP